jgi:hypothetical protein
VTVIVSPAEYAARTEGESEASGLAKILHERFLSQ